MNDKPMQGVSARITGKIYEIKTPPKGPVVLVLRVSHGKDKQTGNYKPSSWYNVKVFAAKQAELGAASPQKDDLITVDVWGATEEWTGQDGNKRSDKAWYLSGFTLHRDAPAPAQSLSSPTLYENPTPQAVAEMAAMILGGRVVEGDDVPF